MKMHFSRKVFSSFQAAVQLLAVCSLTCSGPSIAQEARPKPHIDLAFCIDTTGSMGGEIESVKTKTKQIVAKIAAGKPTPVVRVGLVAYRDRGDQYVTKVYPFTEDIDHVVKDISELRADGGGDTPESVNEGLHVAVHDLKWSNDRKTVKLLFLIGDAEPHVYPNDYNWKTEAMEAVATGIQINTIACQGLSGEGENIWRTIARIADGKFEPLHYGQDVAAHSTGHGGVVSMAAGAPAAMRAAKASYAVSESRADSDLSDIVVNVARDAAKRKLNMDFKEK